VECVELRSRAQCLCILAEQDLRRRRGVDDNNWNISKLDLIHGSPFLCPLSILLGGIDTNLSDISDDRSSWRTLESRNACLRSNELVYGNI